VVVEMQFIRWRKETWKRGDDWRGGGSGGRHAGYRPRIQTHRRPSRAACDRMRQLPVSQKTNAVSVPSPPPLPLRLLLFLVLLSDVMRMRVLAACAAPHSPQDWLLNTTLLSLFSFILLLRLRPGSLSPRTSARLGLSYAKLNVLIIHVKSFYSKTRSRPRSAGRRPGPPL
jgi:hypothetical protein